MKVGGRLETRAEEEGGGDCGSGIAGFGRHNAVDSWEEFPCGSKAGL